MGRVKIIQELGFNFGETIFVEYSNEYVDHYENKTHSISYWKQRDLWSLKDLVTTKTTTITSFENIMYHYFKDISYKK